MAPNTLRWMLVLGILLLEGVAAATFGWPVAFWLLALACLTWYHPAYGVGLLFAVISIDPARPLFPSLFVSLSELELGVCTLALFASPRAPRVEWKPAAWGLPFFGAVLVSGLVNAEGVRALPLAVRSCEMFIALLAASSAMTGNRERTIFSWCITAAALFYSAAGFFQYRHLSVSPFDVTRGGQGRIYSFFGNPNQFAGYLALILPFALIFTLNEKGARRIVWAYVAGIVLLTELASLSRAAWLGTLASSALVYLLSPHRRQASRPAPDPARSTPRPRLTWALLAAWIPGLLLAGLLLMGHSRVTVEVANSIENLKARSLKRADGMLHESRPEMFRFGMTVWWEHFLFGIGPGRYPALVDRDPGTIERYGGDPSLRAHVHSLYLQLGVDFGLLGVAAFLYFVARTTASMIGRRTAWAVGGIGLITAFLTGNLFDVTFPSLALEIGLLLGAACAAARHPEPPEFEHGGRGPHCFKSSLSGSAWPPRWLSFEQRPPSGPPG